MSIPTNRFAIKIYAHFICMKVLHHLGLGDHLMLNGMVRYLRTKGPVSVVIHEPHLETIRFMYRDVDVGIVTVPDKTAQTVRECLGSGDVLPLATYAIPENLWKFLCHGEGPLVTNWCHAVYNQAGVPIEYMRSRFRVDRDPIRELRAFKLTCLERGQYVYVHDDPERDRKIPVTGGLPVFRVSEWYTRLTNLFDYCLIIENAAEVHCMHSSHSWLVELLGLGRKETNFFYNLECPHPYHSVKTVFTDDRWTFKN